MLANRDDLYVVSNPPSEIDLNSKSFLDNPLVVVARKDHPLAGRRNIRLEELNEQPFIMRELGSGTRDAIVKLFAKNDVAVKVKLELGSNEAIKQAIRGWLGDLNSFRTLSDLRADYGRTNRSRFSAVSDRSPLVRLIFSR